MAFFEPNKDDFLLNNLSKLFPGVEIFSFLKDEQNQSLKNFFNELRTTQDLFKIIELFLNFPDRADINGDRKCIFNDIFPSISDKELINLQTFQNFCNNFTLKETGGFFGYLFWLINTKYYDNLCVRNNLSSSFEEINAKYVTEKYCSKIIWVGENAIQCRIVQQGKSRKIFKWSVFPKDFEFITKKPDNIFTCFKRRIFFDYSYSNIAIEKKIDFNNFKQIIDDGQKLVETFTLEIKGEELNLFTQYEQELKKIESLKQNDKYSFYYSRLSDKIDKLYGSVDVSLEEVAENQLHNFYSFNILQSKFRNNFKEDTYRKWTDKNADNYSELKKIRKRKEKEGKIYPFDPTECANIENFYRRSLESCSKYVSTLDISTIDKLNYLLRNRNLLTKEQYEIITSYNDRISYKNMEVIDKEGKLINLLERQEDNQTNNQTNPYGNGPQVREDSRIFALYDSLSKFFQEEKFIDACCMKLYSRIINRTFDDRIFSDLAIFQDKKTKKSQNQYATQIDNNLYWKLFIESEKKEISAEDEKLMFIRNMFNALEYIKNKGM